MNTTTARCCGVERIHVKARWLIRMLGWVRATLDSTDESVSHWLRELLGVADAAEDVVDEFLKEAMRLGSTENGAEEGRGRWFLFDDQVRHCSSPTPPHEILAFLRRVEERIEEIVSMFMRIEKP
ncbi:hypothetical protein Taro_010980 [Colocasia esculenta]|uniref:Disease resistance N-terminal domain-containing protein n=1 Tax=Colocasia esculenta TaxID=4460 RepID=A0A843U547_COLES|nr:hypothetical protein [Colocasia esculenta]